MSSTPPGNRRRISRLDYLYRKRISTLIISSNIIGAVLVTLHFTFLDRPDLHTGLDGTFFFSMAITAVLILIGVTYGMKWSRDMEAVGNDLNSGVIPDAARLLKAQKKALNAPLVYAAISLFNWLCAAAVICVYFLYEYSESTLIDGKCSAAFRIFAGINMTGVITSALIFFLMDRHFRKLRPLYFPNGGLLDVKGVFRLSVRNRLLAAFTMVGVLPMLIICFVFFHKFKIFLSLHPDIVLSNPVFLLGAVPLILIGAALLTSQLVADSINEPVAQLKIAMERVRKGDLSSIVDVAENDEFGLLSESFNHMTEGLIERDRLKTSLNLAMEVQQNLLPSSSPSIEGLDIAGRSIYCDETGGDYYDFIEPGKDGGGSLTLVIGDVADHGISSALLMTTARALIRQRSSQGGSPAEILTDVNNQLCRDVQDSGQFMTLFLCRIDPEKREAAGAGAGHDPLILYDPDSDDFRELAGKGPALGVVENYEYENFRFFLKPGGILVLCTDGIWEAANKSGVQFGKDRLKGVIRKTRDQGADGIIQAVVAEVMTFMDGAEIRDDLTIVVASG